MSKRQGRLLKQPILTEIKYTWHVDALPKPGLDHVLESKKDITASTDKVIIWEVDIR